MRSIKREERNYNRGRKEKARQIRKKREGGENYSTESRM